MLLVYTFLIYVVQIVVFANPCIPRKFDYDSVVCVCNETYCDTYKSVKPIIKGSFVQYISSLGGLRLEKQEGIFESASASFLSYEILISPSIQYQHILGWGAHFTDTTGEVLNALPIGAQRRVLQSYWSGQGNEYSLARVPMAGTDFSKRFYTYMDKYEDGMQLKGFNLTKEDHILKIPHILTAINVSHNPIRFIATPWTAPKWMKNSNNSAGGELKPEYYQAFAEYYIKFLDAYRSHGIDFWGITTGNEPVNGYIPNVLLPLPSMAWNAVTATKWMRENLGPTIRHSHYYKNTKIIIHDDQRVTLPSLQLFCLDKEAMKYPDGIATHWYADFYTPEIMLNLAGCQTRDDLFLLMNEATSGLLDKTHVTLGNWKRAEDYVNSIFTYMEYRYSGWMDWNLAVDTHGGPSLTGYNVDSCIIINATSGEFYKQPTFYAMAHFSKFVPPGSVRIKSESNGKLIGLFFHVKQVAFKRPDGGIVVVLHNEAGTYVDVEVKDESRGQIKLSLKPNSISTILYW